MESTIGLFKTELIKPRRPWRGLDQVELATAEWVDRLLGDAQFPATRLAIGRCWAG